MAEVDWSLKSVHFDKMSLPLECIPWPEVHAFGWSPSQFKADKTWEPISHHLEVPLKSSIPTVAQLCPEASINAVSKFSFGTIVVFEWF